jgi:hypothetical protein
MLKPEDSVNARGKELVRPPVGIASAVSAAGGHGARRKRATVHRGRPLTPSRDPASVTPRTAINAGRIARPIRAGLLLSPHGRS